MGRRISFHEMAPGTPLIFDDSQRILLNLVDPENSNIDSALASNALNVLVLVGDEKQRDSVINRALSRDPMAVYKKIYFEDKKPRLAFSEEQFVDNVKYAIIFGKVYSPPVDVIQGNIKEKLPLVVQQMVSPGGKVTVFNETGLVLPQIHASNDIGYRVVYWASPEDLKGFLKKPELKFDRRLDHYSFPELDSNSQGKD